MLAILASTDTAKIAYIVACVLFAVCAIVSAIDKAIVWAIGFAGLAIVAFGLYASITR